MCDLVCFIDPVAVLPLPARAPVAPNVPTQGSLRARTSVRPTARPSVASRRQATLQAIAPAPQIPNPNNVGPIMYVARNAHLTEIGPRR